MRLLLDTHALLWWLLDHPRLSARARSAVANPNNEVYASSVSAFEIATKHRIGKLPLGNFSPSDFGRVLEQQRLEVLAVTWKHGMMAGQLGGPHGDPFDRLLIAQCQVEEIPIVTSDPVFNAYGVETLW